MALRIRRGTDAERQTIVPLQGEPVYVTDTNKLFIGDGATQGGILVGPQSQEDFDLVNDTSPQLGGNLDLNGNDITGTGNISIDGTITATGAVNLGDNAGGDTLNVGALITSSLRPSTANAYDIGTPLRPWANAYIRDIVASETVEANNITVKENIVSENSTVIYNGSTDSLSVTNVSASNVTADLIGSVFMDDSTTQLVDGINGTFTTRGGLKLDGQQIISPDNGLQTIDFRASTVNMTAYGLEGDIFTSALVVLNGSRGLNEDQAADVQVGDFIGGFVMTGQEGNAVNPKVGLAAQIDAKTGSADLPGKFVVLAENWQGNIVPQFEVNAKGVASATSAMKMTTYANDAARDAGITVPEAGMIIFNQRDDSTGVPQFQGYDGTQWVDLH